MLLSRREFAQASLCAGTVLAIGGQNALAGPDDLPRLRRRRATRPAKPC